MLSAKNVLNLLINDKKKPPKDETIIVPESDESEEEDIAEIESDKENQKIEAATTSKRTSQNSTNRKPMQTTSSKKTQSNSDFNWKPVQKRRLINKIETDSDSDSDWNSSRKKKKASKPEPTGTDSDSDSDSGKKNSSRKKKKANKSEPTRPEKEKRSTRHAAKKQDDLDGFVIDSEDVESDKDTTYSESEWENSFESKSKNTKVKFDSKKNKTSKKAKVINRFDSDDSDLDDDDQDYEKSDKDNGTSDESGDDEKKTVKNIDECEYILNLFNNASIDEIKSTINYGGKSTLEEFINMRPFKDYEDLRTRANKTKNISKLVTRAEELMFARNKVNVVLNKCEEIGKKLEKKALPLIKHKYETDNISKLKLDLKSQPKSLNKSMILKPFQLVGLNWLCLIHSQNLNGILADEMGLGKTCQTISFLAFLLEEKPKSMHLVIVPSSTLENWSREIKAWLPNLNFIIYNGSQNERCYLRKDILKKRAKNQINLILTSYSFLYMEEDMKFFHKSLKLDYCVFDEAHMLKNMDTLRYKSLMKVNSKRKLLLTGTPLQNNITELISLLYFVMPQIFQNNTKYLLEIFKSKPTHVDIDTFYQEKVVQAKGIMEPFILRRIKQDVLKQLPDKSETEVYCDMTEFQTSLYNNLLACFQERRRQMDIKSTIKNKSSNNNDLSSSNNATASTADYFEVDNEDAEGDELKILNSNKFSLNKRFKERRPWALLELRLIANHPLLRRARYTDKKLKEMASLIMLESSDDTVYEFVLEDLSVMSDFEIHNLCPLYKGLSNYRLTDEHILSSGKFNELDKLLKEKKESGDRVLLFSQFVIMIDIFEEFLKIKSYTYVRLDGSTQVSDRQSLIDKYNKNPGIFIFLLSTKAGGVGINLTSANVVIMHDIDLNPYNDKQAEDRCHRVGQTKVVQVYKLISRNSVDETLLKIQTKKLTLGSDISGEKINDNKFIMNELQI